MKMIPRDDMEFIAEYALWALLALFLGLVLFL